MCYEAIHVCTKFDTHPDVSLLTFTRLHVLRPLHALKRPFEIWLFSIKTLYMPLCTPCTPSCTPMCSLCALMCPYVPLCALHSLSANMHLLCTSTFPFALLCIHICTYMFPSICPTHYTCVSYACTPMCPFEHSYCLRLMSM